MDRMAVLLCMSAAFAAAPAAGEPDAEIRAELAALCQKDFCREASPIRLKLPNGETFAMTPTSPTPIVAGGMVTVYPGETVLVEATEEEGRLTRLTAVQTARHPERTLTFRLTQEASIGDGTGMVLKVDSPFAGVIKYRLGMMLPSREDLLRTSACPLRGGQASYEHWPHPIFQIVAADFRLVDSESKAATTCE